MLIVSVSGYFANVCKSSIAFLQIDVKEVNEMLDSDLKATYHQFYMEALPR